MGAFIGAGGDEIAFLPNTSAAANAIASGIDWQPGDEVILPDDEFGSNALPWLALRSRGVRVTLLPHRQTRMTPGALGAAITPRTRAVAVSWVAFHDGYRHDLAALAEVTHAAGAFFCVDVIQGLGAFPLDVRRLGIDVAYGGGQKWLLALQGSAFLYVKREVLDRIAVTAPGWRSLEDIWDFLEYEQPYGPGAARFEAGTPNFAGALSLTTSVDVLREAGAAPIAQHVLRLTDHLVEGLNRAGMRVLSQRGDGCSSGIVTFTHPSVAPVSLGKRVQAAGFVVTARPQGVRVAPHAYNTVAEIDAFLEAL